MLKKTLLFFAVFSLFQVGKSFAKSELSIWGGYNSVSMDKLNESMSDDFTAYDILGFDINRNEIKGGPIIGLDYLFDISETLSLGPRFSFLFVESGEFSTGSAPAILKLAGINGMLKEEMKTFILPITIGGRYNKNLGEKSNIYIKGFAGLGIINAKDSQISSGNIDNPAIIYQLKILYPNLPANFTLPTFDSSDWDINETSSCLVVDLSLGASYELSEVVEILFDLGYLSTPEIKIRDFTFNYSGLKYIAGLKFKF